MPISLIVFSLALLGLHSARRIRHLIFPKTSSSPNILPVSVLTSGSFGAGGPAFSGATPFSPTPLRSTKTGSAFRIRMNQLFFPSVEADDFALGDEGRLESEGPRAGGWLYVLLRDFKERNRRIDEGRSPLVEVGVGEVGGCWSSSCGR
jgi:hypothetical protein